MWWDVLGRHAGIILLCEWIFEYEDENFDSYDAAVFFVDVEVFAHVLIMYPIKKIWIFLLLFYSGTVCHLLLLLRGRFQKRPVLLSRGRSITTSM